MKTLFNSRKEFREHRSHKSDARNFLLDLISLCLIIFILISIFSITGCATINQNNEIPIESFGASATQEEIKSQTKLYKSFIQFMNDLDANSLPYYKKF